MEFDLVSPAKIIMSMRRKITIASFGFMSIFWIVLCVCGVFKDCTTFVVITLLFFLLQAIISYPYIRYRRISCSIVKFTCDSIQFIDTKGICWRTIPYTSITKVKTETIYGTFYGEKKDEVEGTYLCFFLNCIENIPDVSYPRLFTHNDFAMVYYSKELYEVYAVLAKAGGLESY